MAAKVLYTANGSDPATLYWPAVGPAGDRHKFTSGQTTTIVELIGYGDGSITYPDGRLFPALTSQGSTLTHQKN